MAKRKKTLPQDDITTLTFRCTVAFAREVRSRLALKGVSLQDAAPIALSRYLKIPAAQTQPTEETATAA